MKILILSDDEADAVQELLTSKLEDQRDDIQGVMDYLRSETGNLEQLITLCTDSAAALENIRLLVSAARKPWLSLHHTKIEQLKALADQEGPVGEICKELTRDAQ